MTLMLFVLASCSQVHHASHQELEHELISSLENKQQKNSRQIRSFGSVDEAISFCIEHDQYDSDTLEYIALKLLQAGMQSEQAQDKLIGLYGIKIAQDERVEPLVAHAMKSQDPYVQLAALQVLGSYLTDESNRAIELALKSDFLLIRLEAAYLLAQRKLPKAYPQLESLFMKVPDEVRSYFPDLFALEGSAASRHMLKKMIHDLDMQVRKEAIFAASQASYHELVSDIQIYAEDIHPVIQEVFAYACQVFDLKAMVPQLKKIAHKRDGPQALMAAYTLYTFGDEQGLKLIEQEASKDNLYAMDLLGRMPGQATDLLMEKMHASDHNVRYNAALALLARKDPVCLPVIFSLLADTAYTC
jgi:HEAT repeat protein